MSWLLQLTLGICLIILVGGVVNWGQIYLTSRSKRGQREEDELRARLEAVERRLTEVQEVMLALSEKFDQWQEERLTV